MLISSTYHPTPSRSTSLASVLANNRCHELVQMLAANLCLPQEVNVLLRFMVDTRDRQIPPSLTPLHEVGIEPVTQNSREIHLREDEKAGLCIKAVPAMEVAQIQSAQTQFQHWYTKLEECPALYLPAPSQTGQTRRCSALCHFYLPFLGAL